MIPHFGDETRWAEIRSSLLRKQRYPLDIFRSQLVIQCRPHSPTIEVYHSLRANIQNKLPGKQSLAMVVTSAGVAEGKSLTSLNFCLASAQAGLRTLFVETDVRQPVTHKVFGLAKSPGLIEVLSGKLAWNEVIHETSDFLMGGYDSDRLIAFAGIDNFKLMTGWAASGSDVVQILSSPAVPKMIAELRSHFDIILFDCPPALLFVDALLVGARVDGVVMVYKSGKMARRALKRAKDQVASAHCNILGVVLNDMRSSDMAPRYGYYYDYAHYAQSDEKRSA
jgi:capsular exopolysaccharide synthesis family protein